MKRPLEHEYNGDLTAYTRALEEYCDQKQEPVGEVSGYYEQGFTEHKMLYGKLHNQDLPVGTKLYTRSQASEPLTDEEVNECGMCGYVGKDKDKTGQCPNCRWDELRPLTGKAHQKPLTDDQIYEMYNEPRSDAEMLEFARAIEAAHGIKENT